MPRSPIGAGFEIDIAHTSVSASGEEGGLTVMCEIRNHHTSFSICDYRTHGHPKHDVFGASPIALRPSTSFAISRAM
jgi:hypothetical protein